MNLTLWTLIIMVSLYIKLTEQVGGTGGNMTLTTFTQYKENFYKLVLKLFIYLYTNI